MSKVANIITKIQKVIPNIANFIQFEQRSNFEIMDYKGESYIIDKIETASTCYLINDSSVTVDYDKNKVFVLENAKGIHFIPIDGKGGLFGYGDSFCDGVFFDENDFCFVEFKFNAESIEVRAIRKNRKKGIAELGNTIDEFDDYEVELFERTKKICQ